MPKIEVLLHPDAPTLAASVAARLIATLVESQAAGVRPHLVLTGGGIGTAVLAAVAAGPGRASVDWRAVDIWWGDERYLNIGDAERNDTGARDALLDLVEAQSVHSIEGPDSSTSAEESADSYAAELASCARPEDHGSVPRFDVVLLGIGPDGHVASLFPEHPSLHDVTDSRSVIAIHAAPKPPAVRISLTRSALCAGREVWFLAAGQEKATAVRLALDESAGFLQVPAAGVRGRDRTLFLIDNSAASKLPKGLGRPAA